MSEKTANPVEIKAWTLHGIEGAPVRLCVEATQRGGLSFVGWKEASAREISIRVRSTLETVSVRLEDGAALRVRIDRDDYSGAALDLSAAVAIAAYAGRIDRESLVGKAFAAELGMDGRLRPVRGVLSIAEAAKAAGARVLYVAEQSRREAEQVGGLRVDTPADFGDLLGLLERDASSTENWPGQCRGKAWREACAAVDRGARYLLLVGSPGAGKQPLARALSARLPSLEPAERLEVARIYSATGLTTSEANGGQGWTRRPFRAPHHSVSVAGLLGGGNEPRPGEVSLSHRGTLLLDEAHEFSMRTIDELGHVLERGQVALGSRERRAVLPAVPRLVIATAAPCPCGYRGASERRECRCTPESIRRYESRGLGRLGELIEHTVTLVEGSR